MEKKDEINCDEWQIRRLIADHIRAICARDIDAIMSCYDADFVAFDLGPAFQTKGLAAWRSTWEESLPCLPAVFDIEVRDLSVTVHSDLAFAYWLFRFTTLEKRHPAAQTWYRLSADYRRSAGKWRVIHEHLSVPFDPETYQAVRIYEPG